MSTAIGTIGRGGRNRSLIAGMMAMVAASSFDSGNVVEIKAGPGRGELLSDPMIKLPAMSPRDFARYRNKCGRPRKKNLHHYARLAKVKRRKA